MHALLTGLFAMGQGRHLAAGEYLFHRHEVVDRMFLVERGEVRLVRYQENGNPVTLQRMFEMDIAAEASLFSERYHCDAVADVSSLVRSVPKAEFLMRLGDNQKLSNAWAERLAREVQRARLRSEILSLRTVSQRLDAWLTWNGELPSKGQWQGLAFEIGVSPEAFYRELGKRRRHL